MQQQARDTSVVASLAELRAIEQQRLVDEKQARERIERERREAIAAAERQRVAQAEAKARAEHEQQLAIERAKSEAEREARLRVEAAESAERAKQLMIIESARAAHELEIQRTVAARTRPTWMIAVTALATVVAGVFVWFALESRSATEQANEAARIAAAQRQAALEEMKVAKAQVDQLDKDMKVLDTQIEAALARHEKEKDAAKKAAAAQELVALREKQRLAAVEAERIRRWREHQVRIKGHVVNDECLKNAVCK